MLNRIKSLFVSSKADRYRLNPRGDYTDVVYMVREGLIEFKDINFEQMKNLRFNINNKVDYSSLYHAAIVADYKNYELFPLEWKEDSDTILLGIITHPEFYGALPAEKKGVFSFLFKAWQTHPDVYPELAIELKKEKGKTINALMATNFESLFVKLLLPSEYEEWSDFFIENHYTCCDKWLPTAILSNFDWCLEKIKTKKIKFRNVSIELKNDPYFVHEVLNLRNTDISVLAEMIPEIGSDLKRKLGGKNYLVGLKELCSREILVDKYQIGKDERDASVFSSAL